MVLELRFKDFQECTRYESTGQPLFAEHVIVVRRITFHDEYYLIQETNVIKFSTHDFENCESIFNVYLICT